MSEFMDVIRPVVETSSELEKRIMDYAREGGVRMARVRRQLIERGLAIEETELPDMTEGEKRTFREEVKRLYLLIKSKKH